MDLSQILLDFEKELINEIIGEIKARCSLLARAVASAEAVVRAEHEAKISVLMSDFSVAGQITPFARSRSPASVSRGTFVAGAQSSIQPIPEDHPSGFSVFTVAEVPPDGNLSGLESSPLSLPVSRKVESLICRPPDKDPAPLALPQHSASISLDNLIAQSAVSNGGAAQCGMEMEENYSFTPKVSNLVAESVGAAANFGFVIKDFKAWKDKLEIEFRSRGISDSDTVVVKDLTGRIANEVTAKDFANDSRILGLPPLPVNFTYSKSALGNICTVTALSILTPKQNERSALPLSKQCDLESRLGDKLVESKQCDLERTGSRQLDPQRMESMIRERWQSKPQSSGSRSTRVAKAITASSRRARGATGSGLISEAGKSSTSGATCSSCQSDLRKVTEHFEFLPLWLPSSENHSEPPSPKNISPKLERVGSFDSQDSSGAATFLGTQSVTSVCSGGSNAALYISEPVQNSRLAILQSLIVRPTSFRCISWDSLKSLAMIYDLIVIPLSAFSLPDFMVLRVLDATVSCIWVLDILASFLRGYIDEKHGVVEMRASQIAMRYIGTWFFFDVSVVTIDICLITMENTLSMHGFINLFPMLRLIRLMKLPSLLSMLTELLGVKANTEKWSFILRIFKLLTVFLFINHFISCGWYAIGQLEIRDYTAEGNLERWIETRFEDRASTLYRYTTCFHWSLTQFTPASMEVTPTNWVERLYNVCIIVCGFVMFSSFVSMMTQSITQLQQANLVEKNAMRKLRRFLAENSIKVETIGKIMFFLQEDKKTVRKKKLHEEDVDTLKSLPHSLRQHIRVEMFHPVLCGHPLFEKLGELHSACFKNLCHDALYEKAVTRGEVLFHFGMEGQGMYFMADGLMHYYLGYDRRVEDFVSSDRGGKIRLCEAALWVRWVHRGRCVGEEATELVLVQTSQFIKICSHSTLVGQMKSYALMFARNALKEHGDPLYMKDTWDSHPGSDMETQRLIEYAFRDPFLGVFDLGLVFHAWRDQIYENGRRKRPFWERFGASSSSIWGKAGRSATFTRTHS